MTQYIVLTGDIQVTQAAKLRTALTDASNAGNDIYLIISSGGGNVFEGMSLSALMRTLPVTVTTHNIGQIDSIAGVVFAAGTIRYSKPTASFMFHGVSMHFESINFVENQLKEQYLGLKKMREDIAATFAAHAGLKAADIDALMISGTTVLSAQESLSKGIIHEIRDVAVPPGSQIITIGNA